MLRPGPCLAYQRIAIAREAMRASCVRSFTTSPPNSSHFTHLALSLPSCTATSGTRADMPTHAKRFALMARPREASHPLRAPSCPLAPLRIPRVPFASLRTPSPTRFVPERSTQGLSRSSRALARRRNIISRPRAEPPFNSAIRFIEPIHLSSPLHVVFALPAPPYAPAHRIGRRSVCVTSRTM